jgi:BirA family biotin operon repressor/biotin-[acetyl-CoA-carboxylase] ligase
MTMQLATLNARKISQVMNPELLALIPKLEILESVDSTNHYLLQQPTTQSGDVCLAEQQTHGRGRRGRQWYSPPGANIYLSIAWEFPASCKNITNLGIVTGIVVAQTLQAYGLKNIKLKWPNDLVIDDEGKIQKLGGLLIEIEKNLVIMGIGLNVAMSHLSVPVDQAWVDMASLLPHPPDRDRIIGYLLNNLFSMLLSYPSTNKIFIQQYWPLFDLLYQRSVCVTNGKTTLQGMAMGVDDLGGLLVHAEKVHTFYSGDVSVRLG